MAYTINDLNALTATIAQGALTVKYADKEVTYRSQNDLFRLRREMEVELGITKLAPKKRLAQFSKGLNCSE